MFASQGDTLAAYSVLIAHTCTDPDSVLPESVDGMPIHTTGAGSVFCGKSVKSITVPDSVREISKDTFRFLDRTKRVSVPAALKFGESIADFTALEFRVTLSESERRLLPQISTPLTRGRLLLKKSAAQYCAFNFMNNPGFQEVYDGPLPVLIFGKDSRRPPFDRYDVIDPNYNSSTENEIILRMIAEKNMLPLTPDEDAMQDDRLRRRESMPDCLLPTCILYIMDPPLRTGNGYKSTVRPLVRVVFRPLLVPVKHKGRQYYIYFRCFPRHKNFALPVCVYAEDGLVTSRALSEAVYAKYRFASLL